MTSQSIKSALKARRVGTSWIARCPAHDDRDPSLSICEKNGKILVHCHAGCSQRDVIDALKARGLWGLEIQPERRRIIAEYGYTDAHGELLYQVVRFEPKSFAQRYWGGADWVWRKHPRQVLYHLPEVLEAPIVFLVEGEKDVEALRSHGFVATTNAGGANAPWLPQFNESVAGREIILIADNDPPGRHRVARIARDLLGKAARIVILELEHFQVRDREASYRLGELERAEVKDISHWFELGHSEAELISQLESEGVRS